jgi:hypothetical protein
LFLYANSYLYTSQSFKDTIKDTRHLLIFISLSWQKSSNPLLTPSALPQRHSLESVARDWLEQYAKRKSLEEHTKHKRIRKFENHLFPMIGHYPIDDLRPKHLRKVLNHIYEKSADNAQRIRADLILIFSYAVQYGLIEVNHAREMESLDLSAPKNHRPALPLHRLPELIRRIRADSGDELTKLSMELGLHIFIRSSERKRMMLWWSQYLVDIEAHGYFSPYSYVSQEGVS